MKHYILNQKFLACFKIDRIKITIFTQMSKFISIALSSIILIQSLGMTVHDIAQIGKFIEHAQYHSEAYGDNVFVFISKHYGDLKANHEQEHQEEKKEHDQLPFNHQSHLCAISAFILNTPIAEIHSIEFSDYQCHNFIYQEPSSSVFKEGPFQPPRLS